MAQEAPVEVLHMGRPLATGPAGPYIYKAQLYGSASYPDGVVDGDTVQASIDLGLRVWQHNVRVRLFGVAAPEVRGIERLQGLASRDALRALITRWLPRDEFLIRTHKDQQDKYGRWLGELWTPDALCCLNWLLVQDGHAVWRVDW